MRAITLSRFVFSICLLIAGLSFYPAKARDLDLIRTYSCGAFTLSFMPLFETQAAPDAPDGAVVLLAELQQGKTVLYKFDIDQEPHLRTSCRDVTGDGVPELHVVTFSGGAHCCFVHYVFTPAGHVRLLARIYTGDGGPLRFIQLNGRGPLEAIMSYPFLPYTYASFAETAFLPHVFALVNGRYADASRCFPSVLQGFAARHNEHTTSAAVTRLAAALVRGDGQAVQRLLATAPEDSRGIITRLLPEFRQDLHTYGMSTWSDGAFKAQPVGGPDCQQLR